MTEPGLFAIGCGVTFLFLGGAYIVIRSRLTELHGVTSRPEEVEVDSSIPWSGTTGKNVSAVTAPARQRG